MSKETGNSDESNVSGGGRFKEELKAILKDKGVTQKDLAIMLECSEPTVSRIINGQPDSSKEKLRNILNAVGEEDRLEELLALRSPESSLQTEPRGDGP